MTTRASQAGLSLVEVLVSLAIMSAIGTASLALLQSLARTELQLRARTVEFDMADQALALLRSSLLNADPSAVAVVDGQLRVGLADDLTLVYRITDDGLQRDISDGQTTLSQSLSTAMIDGTWQVAAHPKGQLVTLSFRLSDGGAGSRTFFVPLAVSDAQS